VCFDYIRYKVQVETVGNQNVCAISIELFTARSLLHVLACNYSTVQH
jgi:hypothetical protein